MVQASIRYVKQALISTGHGWMDAEPEIERIKPDMYAVNEDGDKPEKRAFCAGARAGVRRAEADAQRGAAETGQHGPAGILKQGELAIRPTCLHSEFDKPASLW